MNLLLTNSFYAVKESLDHSSRNITRPENADPHYHEYLTGVIYDRNVF